MVAGGWTTYRGLLLDGVIAFDEGTVFDGGIVFGGGIETDGHSSGKTSK